MLRVTVTAITMSFLSAGVNLTVTTPVSLSLLTPVAEPFTVISERTIFSNAGSRTIVTSVPTSNVFELISEFTADPSIFI